jgi:hypothetical protein
MKIEDAATMMVEQFHEKSLRDYLQAHMEEKDTEGDLSNMVERIHQDFRVCHAISVFDFLVKKMRDRL